jgi:hypothetical protein
MHMGKDKGMDMVGSHMGNHCQGNYSMAVHMLAEFRHSYFAPEPGTLDRQRNSEVQDKALDMVRKDNMLDRHCLVVAAAELPDTGWPAPVGQVVDRVGTLDES